MKPTEDIEEMGDYLEFLYNLDTNYRGKFILISVWIERIIEDIISYIFFPNEDDEAKRDKMISFILSRNLNFNTKLKVFQGLLEEDYKELFNEYDKLFKDLNDIKNFRNILAHSELDTSVKFLRKRYKDRIQLIYHETGKRELRTIKIEEFERNLNLCNKIIHDLEMIKAKIIVSK